MIWLESRWKVLSLLYNLALQPSRVVPYLLQTLDNAQQHLDDTSPCHSSTLHALLSLKRSCPRSCTRRSASQRVLSTLFPSQMHPSRFLPNFVPLCFGPSRHVPNIEPLTRVKSNPNDILRLVLPCFLHSQSFATDVGGLLHQRFYFQRVHSRQWGLTTSPTHTSLLILLLLAGWPLRHVSALRYTSTRDANTHRFFAFAAPLALLWQPRLVSWCKASSSSPQSVG